MKKIKLIISFLLLYFSMAAQWQKTSGPCYASINCAYYDSLNIFAGSTTGELFISSNGGNAWTRSILTNKGVNAITKRGVNLFVGTNEGAFVTITNGANWFSINSGLSNTTVLSLATMGQKVIAGTAGGGIYFTTNDGASWNSINNGLPTNSYVNSLVVNGTSIYGGTNNGLYLSTNSGASWTQINIGVSAPKVSSIAINGTNIFVGTKNNGLFLSIDNGQTWNAANNGLTNTTICSIEFSGNKVFLGTKYGGVFSSSNNGSTWNSINNGLLYTYVKSLISTGTDLFAGTVGGGLYKLSNNSWTETNNGVSKPLVYKLFSDSTDIYCSTAGNGIFKNSNNTVLWSEKNSGKDSLPYNYSITKNGQNIYIGGFKNILTSNNGGDSWSLFSTLPTTYAEVFSFLFTDSIMFVGTFSEGVFKSLDTGVTWTSVNSGLPSQPIVNTMSKVGNKIYIGLLADGLYSSVNNGDSWIHIPLSYGFTSSVNHIINIDSSIYVATDDDIFISHNNGGSWIKTNSANNGPFYCLATNGTNIYIGSGNGVYELINDTYISSISTGMNSGTAVYSLDINDSNLFAGTGDGIWKIPISDIVSINQQVISNEGINIYPNPASSFINIDFDRKNIKDVDVKIYSISGTLIKKSVLKNPQNRIDVSKIVSGNYLLKIKSNTQETTQKLIIQK